jgi:hypothetical protein
VDTGVNSVRNNGRELITEVTMGAPADPAADSGRPPGIDEQGSLF